MVNLTVLFLSLTTQYNLPPKLLDSVCYIESHYDVNAIHKDDGGENSLGVCQVKLSTAKWLGFTGNEKQLMRPEVNAKYAAKFLRYQLNRYHDNEVKAVTAYNRGHSTKTGDSKYMRKVFKKWAELEKI